MVNASPPAPKWPRRQPSAAAQAAQARRQRLIGLMLVFFAIALGMAAYRLIPALRATPTAQLPQPPAPVGEVEPVRLVTLFYAHAGGGGLASEIRKRPLCRSEADCLRDLILALGENPGSGLIPLLPSRVDVRSVTIDGATANVDLGQETVNHLPGGAMTERLVLAALVNTLAVNFPQVQQLSVQIDGTPVETLKGHIDLRRPFAADFSLVRRPLQSIPAQSGTSL